jgi:fructose-specific phosphotransferase system component IIB
VIGVERLKVSPMTKIVASSSWLIQIDHTLMAAEALRNTAAAKSLLHRD